VRPTIYPPFEIQAISDALDAIADGIVGFKLEAIGKSIQSVWLRDRNGGVWFVAAAQRDLRFKFEVFSLGIESIEQLRARWRNWKAPVIPADMPEPFRSLMSHRPSEPKAPNVFDDWPLKTQQVEVLRRAEFIVDVVDEGSTFGDNPNVQSAAQPGRVPPEASASCEVAVGLLFSGPGSQRLLLAADWFPMTLTMTREAAAIDEFAANCQRVDLRDYMETMPRG
jgi:hypothetical protein